MTGTRTDKAGSRRTFIKGAAIVGTASAAASALPMPAIAQSMPELKWRMPLFIPKTVETVMAARQRPREIRWRSDRRQIPTAAIRRRRNRSGRSGCAQCRRGRAGRVRHDAVVLFVRQGPSLCDRLMSSVRLQLARPDLVAVQGRRHPGAERVPQRQRVARSAGVQLDGPDGRFLPQGSEYASPT